jgi:single-stranded-DNA-specific exonuclease
MSFPEIFEALLSERGLIGEKRDEFLNPSYTKLHSPLLLPNMEKARDRVIRAMKENEHIVVYSDYDADGIPGAVVLADFFNKAKYKNVSFYIPHRHDEGFGLNKEAIDEIAERGAKLIITVDCGTADIKEVERANKKKMDVIITDHHEQGTKLPKAYAIVNPKLKNSKYPFKEICGSAVAYKLVQAILEKERFGIGVGQEKWSLDMVGIATLSDMVPLVGENRILAKFGLDVLRKSPRPGLVMLLQKLNIEQRYLTEDDVAFMITPRINAASRMGKPEDAFKLLSTTDIREADKLADHLEKINNERKGTVAALVKEAKKHLSEREAINKVIVVGNPEWRPSLAGLVANSLVEEYNCPVFVWGRDGDNILKGSCRSDDEVDLYMLMGSAADLFIEHGGHAGAGGFSVSLENLNKLEEQLSKNVEKVRKDSKRDKNQETKNIIIELGSIGEKLWETVSTFAPFGTGNPKPVFEIPKAKIKSAKNFGKTGDHLEIILDKNIKAISFFNTIESTKASLAPASRITLTAHLEKSYFRNRPEIRLRIVDILSG